MSGTLYIVATPIGNLADISQRALDTLAKVDLICAEDTRHSQKLLNHFSLNTPLQAYHDHNETERAPALLELLRNGQHIALVSDAGTPLINDPGYRIVALAREQGIAVVPIPGPCALITALCAAGLAVDEFQFIGFLPAKSSARVKCLQALMNYQHTFIAYESSHRILGAIKDYKSVFADQATLVVARELTKLHESFYQGSAEQVLTQLEANKQQQKGEFVVLCQPKINRPVASDDLSNQQFNLSSSDLLQGLLAELSPTQAAKIAARLAGGKRQDWYQLAEQLKGS